MKVMIELYDLYELRHTYQNASAGDHHPATKRTDERIHNIIKEAETLQAKYQSIDSIRKLLDLDDEDTDGYIYEQLETGHSAFESGHFPDPDCQIEREGYFMAERGIPLPDAPEPEGDE